MARKKQTRGDCIYCGREMTKGGLSRHLKSCPDRLEAQAEANRGKGQSQFLYHSQVQDAWGGDFWLHLEIRGDALLVDLDHYLRAIWLECCGHLSGFRIGPDFYTQVFDDGWGVDDEKAMDIQVRKVFTLGSTISYIYDFGTTSELTIKVVTAREGKPTTAYPVALMARNKMPLVSCMDCGQQATFLCIECMYEREDGLCALCGSHAETHPCRNYGSPMPLVNSPRSGMCGYDGPAEPPY